MKSLEMYEGAVEDIEAIGATYLPMVCGEPLCTCHLDYPYAAIIWAKGKPFLIGQAEDAVRAITLITDFRNEFGMEWKWEMRLSEGLEQVLGIESAFSRCLTDKRTHHKEDTVRRLYF